MEDGPIRHTDSLRGQGEGILRRQQQKGQIILPEILIKAILGRQIQQTLDLVVNPLGQRSAGHCPLLPVAVDRRQLREDALLTQLAE